MADDQSGNTSPEAVCHVMDVFEDENAKPIPLSNRCYQSRILDIVALEPEQTAKYRCRWIHIEHEDSFEAFLAIVEETLRIQSDGDWTKIIAALRRLRHQQELKGMGSPNFRPGIFPLFGDEWHENLLHYLQESQPYDDQPVFVAIPTLQTGVPYRISPMTSKQNTLEYAKSLLEYHYRFNGGLANVSRIEGLVSPTPASVSELWCVVIDKKNIITASHLKVDLLWPNARGGAPKSMVDTSFTHAFWQHTTFHTTILAPKILTEFGRGLFVGSVGLIISQLLPFGWLMYEMVDAVTKRLYDVEFSTSAKLLSFNFLMENASDSVSPVRLLESAESMHRLVGYTEIPRVRGADNIKLCSLWEYVRRWRSVEAGMRFRMHEDSSAEIFTILKELWTIAIVFSANFYLNPENRQIYALGPMGWGWSFWRRRSAKLKRQGQSSKPNPLDVPIYHNPRRPGETLRDLEEDLSKGIAELDRQLQLENSRSDSGSDDDRETALLLEEIYRSGKNASLFCLLRVCIFSTPSRFTSFNNLVVDFYARKISRLEWLIRDRVTQSVVYELSRLEDELRIAKDIILSQRGVVAKIAERFSAAVLAEGAPTPEHAAPIEPMKNNHKHEGACGSNRDLQTGLSYRRSTPVMNALPAKARTKYDTLLADLDKLADTVERLKRQAALLLDIKTEGQNTAIFVFTIVTVIFLPLSFVSSYFGMNTSDIRNMDQGQWIFWAVGLTLTLVILIAVWLISVKERGWRTSRQAKRLQYPEW